MIYLATEVGPDLWLPIGQGGRQMEEFTTNIPPRSLEYVHLALVYASTWRTEPGNILHSFQLQKSLIL